MNLPSPGDVIADKYVIESVLGQGGFGRVYRGTTKLSERPVAIKALKPGRDGYDPKLTERFQRELRAIAKLQSPYTLTLFDYGRTEHGILYMVTEYIDGQDLNEVLATRGTLSEDETAHLLMQLLLSLDEAHSMGILHRDLKPANIRLFEYQGDPLRAKLLDFGLARSVNRDEARLTSTGNVIGTPRFMSPEQIRNEDLTPASDVFSLGLVALECIAGFEAVSLSQPVRVLPETAAVSDNFRAVVNGMLELERDRRIPSARAAYEALRGLRSKPPAQPAAPITTIPIRPPAPSLRTPAEPHAPRSRGDTPVVLASSVLLAVVVVVVAALSLRTEEQPPSLRATPTALLRPQPDPFPVPQAMAPDAATVEVGCASGGSFPTGEVITTVETGLFARTEALLYVPASYAPTERHPLIAAFHDFPSGPWAVMRRSGLKELADQHGVLIVAVADEWSLEGAWDSADDVHRMRAAVESVMETYCIDSTRVFGYGHGAGGRAVDLLPCELPSVVATATTSFRTGAEQLSPCQRSVPHLSIDPQQNPSAPPEGGPGCGTFSRPVSATQDDEAALRSRAGCAEKSEVWLADNHGTCREWSCETALVTCRVKGGREFPGTVPREGFGIEEGCDGVPVDFPYTDVIWRFFDEVAPAGGE